MSVLIHKNSYTKNIKAQLKQFIVTSKNSIQLPKKIKMSGYFLFYYKIE